MMKSLKKSILFVLIFTFSLLFAEESQNVKILSKKMYVNSTDGLRIRDAPSLTGKTIGALVFGSEVEIFETADECTIDGINGNWVKIKVPKLSWSTRIKYGWVFGGYLSNTSNSDVIIKYDDSDSVSIDSIFQMKIENYLLDIHKINNFTFQILVKNENIVTYDKKISGFFINNEKTKLYFYSREGEKENIKKWKNPDYHLSFYEMDLSNFNITEVLQSKSIESGYGIRVSDNGQYLCYPEEGGQDKGSYYVSSGVGAIYDLKNKIILLKKDSTNFYPIGDYFLGEYDSSLYYVYDKNLKFVKTIDLFKDTDFSYTDDEYIPDPIIKYNNSFSYFYIWFPGKFCYKVKILNRNFKYESINNCEFIDYIEIENKVYSAVKTENVLKIFDENDKLIKTMNCPRLPGNMEIMNIKNENGNFYLNISLKEP